MATAKEEDVCPEGKENPPGAAMRSSISCCKKGFLKADQDHAKNDPNDTAVARCGDGIHNGRECLANDMILDPIKDRKINVGHNS